MKKVIENDYKTLCNCLKAKYGFLGQEGLKKEVNSYIKDFIYKFKMSLSEDSLNAMLEKFICELCGSEIFSHLKKRENNSLSY